MNLKILKKLFLLISISSYALGHIGKIVILEGDKQVMLNGDMHSSKGIPIPNEVQSKQIHYIIPKIEKEILSQEQQTIFLYEGLEPLAERGKYIPENGLLLLELTKFHHSIFGSAGENLVINIDNRSFIYNDTFSYLILKDSLAEARKENNKEMELSCLTDLENSIYDCFKDVEDSTLFNRLHKDLSSKFDDLNESLKSILSKSESLNNIFQKIDQDMQKFKNDPNIYDLHRIGSVMVDFNIIANIVNNPKAKKYVVFAGATHTDAVRYFLKDCFDYKETYSTDSKKIHVPERKWDEYCLGSYIEDNREGNPATFYIVSALPDESDFDYIDLRG